MERDQLLETTERALNAADGLNLRSSFRSETMVLGCEGSVGSEAPGFVMGTPA